jgi:hypothetical protein
MNTFPDVRPIVTCVGPRVLAARRGGFSGGVPRRKRERTPGAAR